MIGDSKEKDWIANNLKKIGIELDIKLSNHLQKEIRASVKEKTSFILDLFLWIFKKKQATHINHRKKQQKPAKEILGERPTSKRLPKEKENLSAQKSIYTPSQ